MATNAIESKKPEKASITIKYIREVRMTEKRLRLVLLNIRCYQCDRIEESRRSAQKRTYEKPKVTDSTLRTSELRLWTSIMNNTSTKIRDYTERFVQAIDNKTTKNRRWLRLELLDAYNEPKKCIVSESDRFIKRYAIDGNTQMTLPWLTDTRSFRLYSPEKTAVTLPNWTAS